ncbi:MAG TPA: hypothetical protein VGC27_09705 [Rhizomicrobium sp.]
MTKSIRTTLLLGVLDWLIPFAISFAVFPLKALNYFLFESVMTIAIVFAAILLGVIYFKDLKDTTANFVRAGLLLGLIWLAINLAADLLIFLPKSPMQIPLPLYMSQIGVKYLSIPIITAGLGYLKKQAGQAAG